MALPGQGRIDSDPSAWLALTFPVTAQCPVQAPPSVLGSSPLGVFNNGSGAFQWVISISTAGSIYLTENVGEEAFLLGKKNVNAFLQTLY